MAAIKEWFGLYNIMYDWFEKNYGYQELEEYWRFVARTCYTKLAAEFKEKGPGYVKDYYEMIFAEDGGKAVGTVCKDEVTIEVLESPDIKWMKAFDNPAFKPVPYYFNHYEVIFGEIAQMAGLDFKMLSIRKNGKCKWTFSKNGWEVAAQ
jgi:hypothetical protein